MKPRTQNPRLLRLLPALALFMALAGCEYTDVTVPTYQKGYKPVQPISFSHKLHEIGRAHV